jgi:hypothetical protein
LALGLKQVFEWRPKQIKTGNKEQHATEYNAPFQPSSWEGKGNHIKENAQSSNAPTLTLLLCKN